MVGQEVSILAAQRDAANSNCSSCNTIPADMQCCTHAAIHQHSPQCFCQLLTSSLDAPSTLPYTLQVVKAASGKFHPLHQWFYFDSIESLPDEPLPAEEVVPEVSRGTPTAVWLTVMAVLGG